MLIRIVILSVALSAYVVAEELVDVQTNKDARGVVAVSLRGNATSCGEDYCVAVAGGNASADEPGSVDAQGTAVAVNGDAAGSTAVSVFGDARSCWNLCGGGSNLALSIFGEAEGAHALAGGGDATCASENCSSSSDALAIAPRGDAINCQVPGAYAYCVAIGGGNASSDGEAVAIHGNASARRAASVYGDASGIRTVSVFGNASCTDGTTGPCTAVSVTGHASGTVAVSGCDTASSLGRPEACTRP